MIIINFSICFLFYFIINKYGPIYSLLCNIIFAEMVVDIILKSDYSLINLIIYILSILFIMLYLEIIENFCGLK